MTKVLIKIHARQKNREHEEDVMDLLTEGKQYNKNGVIYLMYEETELSGVKGCVTSLRIQNNVIKLKRYGVKSREMVFETGKRFSGLYETPMGFFEMEILTNRIDNNLTEGGSRGNLEIEYDISLKGFMEAHNVLEIKVAPADDKEAAAEIAEIAMKKETEEEKNDE